MNRKRHCNLYFFEGWIGVAPTVMGLAAALANRGYLVTIYCRRTRFADPGHLNEGVRIEYVDTTSILNRFLPSKLNRVLELLSFVASCWKNFSKHETLHIGIDKIGAIVAHFASMRGHGPTAFLSLELPQLSSGASARGFLDRLFRRAYVRSICCLIQDRARFDALSTAVGYVHPRSFLIPNSPHSSSSQANATNLFRERLQIPEGQFPHIVVHAGTVENIVYSQEIAAAFSGVDLGCALVFHERTARSESDPYLTEIRKTNDRNLFFSLQPVPFDQIDRVYEGATLGLVFYRPLDANLALISMASGKLAYHLKHSTPVIMNDLPALVELNSRYEFGATVSDPSSTSEMDAALRYCLANMDRLRSNARRCYEEEFMFERKVEPFLQFVGERFPA